jgi:predicted nuclease of predicted toxin-antitoxin system
VNVKLLIDENLSPHVSELLCSEGIDAYHVRDRGLLGASDPEVFARALAEDRIVVTANVGDFAALAAYSELHAGVILIHHCSLRRDKQITVVRRALAAVVARGDLINTALHIEDDDTMRFEPLPT